MLLDVLLNVLLTLLKNFVDNAIDLLLEIGELAIQYFGQFAMKNIDFVINIGDFGLNFD